MWIIYGVLAIITTFSNLILYKKDKNYHLAMGIALSFTTLTLTAQYSMLETWLIAEDWAALLDVVPTMRTVLWILTVISILLNLSPAFLELKRGR